MVTVFDFNPTQQELDIFAGDGFSREEIAAMDEDSQLRMIGEILWSRKEKEQAEKYIEQIKDEQLRLDVYRSVTHP